MYDHSKQYRCTIIRGKSQKEMDDLLPIYAKVIDEICPCLAEDFESLFNNAFQRFLPVEDRIKKTLDNHRTEISGKLFGMYFFADDGYVYESERTQKYLFDNDQPAFFKDICYKMQFPNGSQKTQTVIQRVQDRINVRPNAFILKLLEIASLARVDITKKDLGYYVLNSEDVLQGNANPYEVLEAISTDKRNGMERVIKVPGKASSYCYQHINEQINYLELANLVRVTDDKRVVLNRGEQATINLFTANWNEKLDFDVYSFDMNTVESRKQFQFAWDLYFGKLSPNADRFATTVAALSAEPETPTVAQEHEQHMCTGENLTELGDEGEQLIYQYEKNRVAAYSVRLANKVLWVGKTRGLGYDIQSVIALPGPTDEFVKYIEVKSTKRLTCPDINNPIWIDTLNITRNELMAAQQHKEYYSIFRVYFTRTGVYVFVITNIMQKYEEGKMTIVPMTYRIDFSNSCVDSGFGIVQTEV